MSAATSRASPSRHASPDPRGLLDHDAGVGGDPPAVERRLQHPPLAQVEVALARQEPVAEHDPRALEPRPLLERALVRHEHLARQVGPHDDEDVLRADPEVDEVAVARAQAGHDRCRVAVQAGQDAQRARGAGAGRKAFRGVQGAVFSRAVRHVATVTTGRPLVGSRLPARRGGAGACDRDSPASRARPTSSGFRCRRRRSTPGSSRRFYLAGATGLLASAAARRAVDTRIYLAGFTAVTALLLAATVWYWSTYTDGGVPYPVGGLLRDRAGRRRRSRSATLDLRRAAAARPAPAEPGVRGRGGGLRRARRRPRGGARHGRPAVAVGAHAGAGPHVRRDLPRVRARRRARRAASGGRRRCGRSRWSSLVLVGSTAVVSLVHHAKFDGGPSTYVWAVGAGRRPRRARGGRRCVAASRRGAGVTASLRGFLAVLGAALLAQGLASWALDASGNASDRMPYRFANADPRHALIHVVWGGVILVLLARGLDHARLRPPGARLRRLLHGPRGRSAWPCTIRSA